MNKSIICCIFRIIFPSILADCCIYLSLHNPRIPPPAFRLIVVLFVMFLKAQLAPILSSGGDFSVPTIVGSLVLGLGGDGDHDGG